MFRKGAIYRKSKINLLKTFSGPMSPPNFMQFVQGIPDEIVPGKMIWSLIPQPRCLISLKFRTEFEHVTAYIPQTFKVNKSKVKVTA